MPLNREEYKSWVEVSARFYASESLDPIEQAARDLRVVRAARYLLEGGDDPTNPEKPVYDEDYINLVNQIGPEYYLGFDEINVALEIATDRITRELKG